MKYFILPLLLVGVLLLIPPGSHSDAPRLHYANGSFSILSAKEIAGGVEVYIRAWNAEGAQIGFGTDGTIDIERIRIFNPPELVPDTNGMDFVQYDREDDGTILAEHRFRRDPEEALRLAVANAIDAKVDKAYGNIIPGKVGRTTDVYYAESGDGWIGSSNATWSTARTTGSENDAIATTARIQSGRNFGGSQYQIRHAYISFNTSSLPDDSVISAATLQLWVTQAGSGDNDGDDWLVVLQSTRAATTTVANSDFTLCGSTDSPTEGSDRIDIGALTASQYNTWTLDSDGMGWISKTGTSDFCYREGHDVIDSVYAGAGNTANQIRFSTNEQTGTTQDPTLTVTHATPDPAVPFVPRVQFNFGQLLLNYGQLLIL